MRATPGQAHPGRISRIQANGVTLYYEEHGTGGADPVHPRHR
jgi:hypothetical protein